MIVSAGARPAAPRWLRTACRGALLCALPLGLIYCDRRVPTHGQATVDPVGGAALDGMSEPLAAPDEATDVVSRRVAELQKLIHHQEVLWQAVKPGGLSERDGREASGYLTNGMEREITELFLARSATPGDLRSPELSRALAAMRELVKEISQAPDSNARSGEQSRRIRELNTSIYAAIGIEREM